MNIKTKKTNFPPKKVIKNSKHVEIKHVYLNDWRVYLPYGITDSLTCNVLGNTLLYNHDADSPYD